MGEGMFVSDREICKLGDVSSTVCTSYVTFIIKPLVSHVCTFSCMYILSIDTDLLDSYSNWIKSLRLPLQPCNPRLVARHLLNNLLLCNG